jgi:hypothetical protein
MDIPGTCPVVDAEFSYYTVFIGIKANGGAKVEADSHQTTGSTGLPTAPMPSPTEGADITTLQGTIETAVTTANGSDTFYTWDDSDWNTTGNVSTRTLKYANSDSSVAGTFTYTITYDSTGTATLLGTSCPEHGVTNP